LGGKEEEMKTHMIVMLALTAICISSPGMAAEREKVCWPLHFAGVALGITSDSQVSRLLGKGIPAADTGDSGGRIFVDKAHTAKLQAVYFTDQIVGEVTISVGVGGLSKEEMSKAETAFFDPAEGFGNWHALKLGSTEAEVIKNLGEPSEKDEKGGWVYYTSCACEIPEYFTIYFTMGRITKVVFSSPAG
jgi:hypothetical protein